MVPPGIDILKETCTMSNKHLRLKKGMKQVDIFSSYLSLLSI